MAAATKRWREQNPEVAKELGRAWREANSEYLTAKAKQTWINDRERKQEWYRAWSRRNAAKVSARVVQWQKDNPDLVAARQKRRRARRAGASISDFTASDWRALLEEYQGRCFYCGITGVPMEQEHRVPLCRGGNHTKSNIVPSCGPCNRRKATMTDEEFLHARSGDLDGEGRVGHHWDDPPAHGVAG